MKNNDKNKVEKRKKVLKILKRVLDIVLYSWAFILTIALIVGSSCNKKTSNYVQSINSSELVNNQLKPKLLNYDDYTDIYYCRFNGDTNISSLALADIASYLGYGGLFSTVQNEVVLNDYNYQCAYNSNGEFLPLVRVRVVLRTKLNASGVNAYSYRLESVTFYSNDDNITVCSTQTHGYINADSVVDFRYNGSIILSGDIDDRSLLKIAYLDPFCYSSSLSPTNYMFNEQINYNAPTGGSFGQAYLVGANSSYTYNYGMFISGGQIFNQIKATYIDANGSYFEVQNNAGGSSYELVSGDNIKYFAYLEYVNTTTNVSRVVNRRDYTEVEKSGSIIRPVLKSSHWVSQSFRQITFVSGLSDSDIANLGMFNNNSSNINNGIGGNIGLGNVFDLINQSFRSIIGLLSISILPGITIGVLMFLPLVVTMIVLVFKAVKK